MIKEPSDRDPREKAKLSEGYEYREAKWQFGFWDMVGYLAVLVFASGMLGFWLGVILS